MALHHGELACLSLSIIVRFEQVRSTGSGHKREVLSRGLDREAPLSDISAAQAWLIVGKVLRSQQGRDLVTGLPI